MFTGIIEEVGHIERMRRQGDAMILTISCRDVLDGAKIGDSISVNGVCLTVTTYNANSFSADIMVQTSAHTNFATASAGSVVNLERALAAGDRFGGHFVSGHIDGTATVIERREIANAIFFRFHVSSKLTAIMVPKGSVAVNGISLTLVDVNSESFSVSVIPHTLQVTNLGRLNVGDVVNTECDMLGKYVVKMLEQRKNTIGKTPAMTIDFLKENGFA